ncbi:M20 metallopeptidase family protein [Dethiosulfatarculus sandiegensis]|uniref:Peptidase M20 n=1 Tax=Dethiosulfatarculus sandiegensis TaxID=1429043 RepID=A0A0D2J4K9_9BACT|nr:M20 family metallopeptidase [Dethiosulfatarculus sandiegensis]KIX13029.1 peptidase M20 [Dethiosulfatarculus sandiegensis]
MASEIFEKALAIKDYIVEVKRHIHQNPELSMQEFETCAFVKSKLSEMGVELADIDTEIGALGLIRGEKEGKGKVIALRAEMDALPIEEKTGQPDASKVPGVMHACGHDCHTAMLLGTAKLLVSMKDRFSGLVKLIFQPGEEGFGGSTHMIEKGVLEDPVPDYIIGLHGNSYHECGKLALWKGPYMASADAFTARIVGQGGHGAYPHRLGCDSVLAASNAVMALQSIVTRQVDALDNVVLSVCTINGGSAKNVIPKEVEISGTVRCQDKDVRGLMEARMAKVIKSAAACYNCEAELDYDYGVPPLANDPEVVDLVAQSAKNALGEENVEQIASRAMGSEDFGCYLEKVPTGVFARIGIYDPSKPRPVFHSSEFVFDEDVLPSGTAMFTQFVLDHNK